MAQATIEQHGADASLFVAERLARLPVPVMRTGS